MITIIHTDHPTVIVTILIHLVDIAFNATAGRYAALSGAKMNSWSHSSSTAQTPYDRSEIASLGGQGGLFKAAVLAVWHFGTAYGGVNMPIAVVFAMASSRFGVAVLVTCFVSTIVLGTVNESLIKPALIASLLLGSETSPATAATGMSLTSPFWDALSGYLFARMARREGFEICSNKAGFAAGLVYGIFTTISRVLIVLARGPTVSDSRTSMIGSTTRVRNNFESYTVVDPGDRRKEGVFTNSWTFLGQTRSNSYGSSYSVGGGSGTGLFIGNQRVG
ncbi:hypothetical protein V500_00020 [Pseudogymnoascus sp. VKM F-4518 (FW-2643)]|nr:hypothetical protein V500_00020 [Pseudogymnoascus sp. VKM F-4518 (FW-2643)]